MATNRRNPQQTDEFCKEVESPKHENLEELPYSKKIQSSTLLVYHYLTLVSAGEKYLLLKKYRCFQDNFDDKRIAKYSCRIDIHAFEVIK